MDYCEGFKDWVRCFRCESLCTMECPLEKASIEDLGLKLRLYEEGKNYLGDGGVKES